MPKALRVTERYTGVRKSRCREHVTGRAALGAEDAGRPSSRARRLPAPPPGTLLVLQGIRECKYSHLSPEPPTKQGLSRLRGFRSRAKPWPHVPPELTGRVLLDELVSGTAGGRVAPEAGVTC